MRISLKSGATLYPLAGEAAVSERVHSSASGFEIVGEPVIQEVRKVRADYAQPIDRGNLLQRVTFSTSRLFATPAEAELWCLDYDSATPRSGDLYLDSIAPDGAVTRRVLAGAVIQPPRRRTIGCTALMDYEAIGGALTVGVDPVAATGYLQFSGDLSVISNGFAVGGTSYTYIPSGPAAPNEIVTDGVLTGFGGGLLSAIVNAINGGVGGGSPNASVTATHDDVNKVMWTAIEPGTGGNSITSSETHVDSSVSGPTLTGGTD